MARRFLGETLDLHAGGVDLVFPHHENEIAQSVCTHVEIDSKSDGTSYLIRDHIHTHTHDRPGRRPPRASPSVAAGCTTAS